MNRRSLAAAIIAILVLTVGLVLAAGAGQAAATGAQPLRTCHRHHHCPSPTPTSTSPSPTRTSPSSTPTSPSSTPTSTAVTCVQTQLENNGCGPYLYAPITNSNGYDTYVGTNGWACGGGACGPATTTVVDPGHWSTLTRQAAGNGAVLMYPDVQQLTNNWDGSGFDGFQDVPMAALSGLSSSYAETMPGTGTGTIAQAAWDVWVSNPGANSNEIMVWVDNTGRDPEDAGASFDSQQVIAGQTWSLYFYGGHGGETIWSLGARHAAAQQHAGTVNLKALFNALVGKGYQNANATLGQIDFGWEICSTGGVSRAFTVTDYSLTLTP